MKRVFLNLLVVVFGCSLVFAQNNASIVQSGDKNNSTAEQSGTNLSAVVTQTANGSAFYGYYNEAFVDQSGADITATIQQIGNGSAQYYFGNYAEVAQSGANQFLSVFQEGANKHTINGHVSRGVYATQSGANNNAIVEQRGTGNSVTVNQFGVGDLATHIITNTPNGSPRTNNITAQIDQVNVAGSGNLASQLVDPSAQNGELRSSSLSIFQDGSNNVAAQTMHVAWGPAGSMSASQYGNSNEALQNMDFLSGRGNQLSITQGSALESSDGNIAHQFSYGSNNVASISQYADVDPGGFVNNEAYQTMHSSGNNYSITQTGLSNFASQTALSGENVSSVTQAGNMNNAVVTQSH